MDSKMSAIFSKLILERKSNKLLFILASVGMLLLLAAPANYAIPSFARQTGLSCNYCHYTYPELNSFGRMFKLNGYTTSNSPMLEAVSPDSERTELSIMNSLPLSAMIMTSFSSVSKATPGASSYAAELPDQVSVFLSGEITPKIGTYLQFTYDPTAGTFGLDMADIRYANHTSLGGNDLLYGLTLNNNPTIQDVWNTTPVWGFPYVASGATPGPTASTLLQAAPGNEAGLGVYALYNKLIYAEVSFYKTAIQGASYPADSTWSGTIKGVSPYWRLAIQHQWQGQYLEVGTFGISSEMYPSGITGLTDKYTDLGFDAQYEVTNDAGGSWIAHASYITEKQTLDATYNAGGSANPSNTLNSFKIDLSYNFPQWAALSAGYFTTSGTADAGLYAPGDVTGSANGEPNSSGEVLQITFLPWMNTQFALQYNIYNTFNGGSSNYDGSGRNATDNNSLYLVGWLLF